jgi:hypothetical protein
MARVRYVSEVCMCSLFPTAEVIENIKIYVEMFLMLLVHGLPVAMN